MQRAGVAGAAAKLVHRSGVKLAVLVPLDELEEAVAGLPGERAIFLVARSWLAACRGHRRCRHRLANPRHFC